MAKHSGTLCNPSTQGFKVSLGYIMSLFLNQKKQKGYGD